MDQDSAHMVAAFKVSMLKLGEFELWRIRIEQYIWMIDYMHVGLKVLKEYRRTLLLMANETMVLIVQGDVLTTATTLVSCDGLGGYDWSDQVEEGPNYALMAYSSSSSDSENHLDKFIGKAGEVSLFEYSLIVKLLEYSIVDTGSLAEKNLHISDDGKKVDEDPRKDSKSNDQKKEDNVNSTNNVNIASINEVNTFGGKTSIELFRMIQICLLWKIISIFGLTRDDRMMMM
ncbi:hypothetical protein Tco_0365289 [Tanacetum coccineum]